MPRKILKIRDRTIFDGSIMKAVLKVIFKTWFKLTNWRPINNAPKGAGITIAAPHTSNWDVVYSFGSAILLDIKIYFSIKESWCRIPIIGRLIMWCGAIPIDRRAGSQGQVNKIKHFVNCHKNARIFFLFTPEGTRGKVNKWKSGFYHMAQNCHLPIFLAKVDYQTKEAGVFHTYHLTGDKKVDIRSIQEAYKNVRAKFPANQFPKYTGPVSELSEAEALILKAFYSAQGVATQIEIAAKTKAQALSTFMLDFLVEKGFLKRVEGVSDVPAFQLTFAGKGRLLHFYPDLV